MCVLELLPSVLSVPHVGFCVAGVQVVASLCEGAPTHARRLKKDHFLEQLLTVILGMMGENLDDPGWETREELDENEDEDDSTNMVYGEQTLMRVTEVCVCCVLTLTPTWVCVWGVACGVWVWMWMWADTTGRVEPGDGCSRGQLASR